MKYRPHRGGLATSMALMVEFQRWSDLFDHIRKDNPGLGLPVSVEHYSGADDRIGWPETYIVMMQCGDKRVPVGFMDSCGIDK